MRDVPRPEPARGEVRVRIRATAVNRADLLQRIGRYPAPPGAPADIPGLEIAREADAVGDAVTEFDVGDRGFARGRGVGYAAQFVLPPRPRARPPSSPGFAEA